MARQSLPVAMTTESTPFMMPLLWVAARYGSTAAQRLAEMGLVDEVEVALVPALLSQGVPLLPPAARLTTLAFKEHRLYPKSGIVMVRYAVRESTNAVS